MTDPTPPNTGAIPKAKKSPATDETQSGSERKMGKREKKARRTLLQMGLERVPHIKRVVIRKSPQLQFTIAQPEVYKNPNGESYIVFGEAKLQDPSDIDEMVATPDFFLNDLLFANTEVHDNDDIDEGELYLSGCDRDEVKLVMQQTKVGQARAIQALKDHHNDIVDAIMSLTI